MQGELFEMSGSAGGSTRSSQPATSWLDRFQITLRLDHLSIGAILALVLCVLVFSFGVEKGKRFALEEIRARRAKQNQISKEISQVPVSRVPASVRKPDLPPFPARPTSEPQVSEPVLTPSSGKYTLQLVTYFTRARAEKEVARLKSLGFQSFVIATGKVFQVCVEAFEEKEKARQKLGQLKAERRIPPDAYIRPITGNLSI